MSDDEHLEIGHFIWSNYVPDSGQSDCVQGELLRANEKLRDEAQRNGNMNWDEGHAILAHYIRRILGESSDVPDGSKVQLNEDIDRVLAYEDPYTEDDLFDRIEAVIFEWYKLNREPIPHEPNPDLHR